MQRLSASVSLRSDDQADFQLHQWVWGLTEAVAVACYVSRSFMRGTEGQVSDYARIVMHAPAPQARCLRDVTRLVTVIAFPFAVRRCTLMHGA
jgi:hypothetical protein